MNKRITVAVLAATSVLLSLGCNDNKPAVTIDYVQRMNMETFDADPAGQPHQTYGCRCMVAYIKSIKNPAGSGKTYVFKPAKVYVGNDTSNSGWNVAWEFHVAGASWRAGEVTVAPGQTKNNVGCVVVPVGQGSAGSSAYFLNHNSATDNDSVVMVREGNAQANVLDLQAATKQDLEQKCQP